VNRSPGRTADRTAVDGVVLAGGQARRFGTDKRTALLWGRPLLAHAVATMRAVIGGGTLFIATGARRVRLPGAGSAVLLADLPPGHGPLGGIVAALGRARVGVVVLACDVPALRSRTLARVVAAGRAADRPAAAHGPRGWEPLVAYYPRWVLHQARAAISHGVWAPHRLLERLGAIPVEVVDRCELANVNRPSDLARLQARRATPGRQA
jgi:molybdopterin-guanine dinucleotide biosynthesis protein A